MIDFYYSLHGAYNPCALVFFWSTFSLVIGLYSDINDGKPRLETAGSHDETLGTFFVPAANEGSMSR